MRKSVLLVGLLLLLLLATVSAFADPVAATFLRYGYGPGSWQQGFPYYAFIPGFGYNGVTQVFCDDYEHGGSPGDPWLANITVLGSKDLSTTRFNQLPDALTLYEEAGWLLLETQSNGINQWKDMNYAAWHIFDPNSPLDSGAAAWLAAAEVEAGKGFPGIDFNLVDIITPVDQYNPDPPPCRNSCFSIPVWDRPRLLITRRPNRALWSCWVQEPWRWLGASCAGSGQAGSKLVTFSKAEFSTTLPCFLPRFRP